jgi:hypothetical protein
MQKLILTLLSPSWHWPPALAAAQAGSGSCSSPSGSSSDRLWRTGESDFLRVMCRRRSRRRAATGPPSGHQRCDRRLLLVGLRERMPLVRTADGMREPQDRREEIVVQQGGDQPGEEELSWAPFQVVL